MATLIIGASGGIGQALAQQLQARGEVVHGLSRREDGLDITDDSSVAAAASAHASLQLDRLIVATGVLHAGELQPERALRQLNADQLATSFAVNTIGPALIMKYFLPRLRRDGRSVAAFLSARVGSITDNRLGGWYGYRASKAALNQLVRTAAVEIARTRPQAVIVALHPGTVDTAMSRPFQANVQQDQLFTPATSAEHLLKVMDALTPAQSGGFYDWRGEAIPF